MRFGLKALLGTLSPVDSVRLDQAVVGALLEPVALGLYVAAQAFTQLPRVVASSIGAVAYPYVAAELDRDAARRAMWKFFFLGFGLSALVVAVLELMVGDLISLFFGEDFTEATSIAQILLLASLFVAGRRVLTDGVNGLGYPGYGTVAEVTSWILLLPGLAILLPWFGAEGVALALAISWGASLLLLILLALAARRTAGALPARLTEAMRRLAAFPRRLEAQQVFGLAGAALLALLGGLAVAFFPKVALGLVIALSAGLFLAFGRGALAGHTRSLQQRVAARRDSPPRADQVSDDAADAGFDVPRRLYYGGVLLLGLITLRAAGQVTLSDLFFLASFLLACAEFVVLRRRVPVKLPFLLLIGVALFSLGGLLSSFESYQTLKSIAVIARLVFLTVFWFWLGTVVLRRQEHITMAIRCWVVSAAICGAGAIVQLLVGDVIPNGSIDGGRATGFTSHPNDLGALTGIAFVPALMLASRPRIAPATRAWFYALLLLVAAGLILSGSVGALMAAGAATVVWLAFQRISMHALLAIAALAPCLVALVTLQSIRGAPDPIERLAIRNDQLIVARRRNAARISGPARQDIQGRGGKDQGRSLRRRRARSVQRDPTVRRRGLRVRHPQSRDRALVQDRARRTRWNADRIARDSAGCLDRHLKVDLEQRMDGGRDARELGGCVRHLCDDRADPLHASWVDLGGTRTRASRHPARAGRSSRAGREPEPESRPRSAEPDLLRRQLWRRPPDPCGKSVLPSRRRSTRTSSPARPRSGSPAPSRAAP